MTRQQKYTVTIDGETKTIAEWVALGKSPVSTPTVYARIASGMEPIEALLTPREGRGAPRCSVFINGEARTIAEWLHHFGISESRYKSRRAAGWDMISAITYPDRTIKRHTAFGQSLTLKEWSEHPFCVVSFGTLRQRINREKVPIEKALTTPRQKGKMLRTGQKKPSGRPTRGQWQMLVTAWGETKTVHEWANDERCPSHDPKLIYGRIFSRGWEPEDAIQREKQKGKGSAPRKPKPKKEPAPQPKVDPSVMPPALKDAIARIAPATTPELCSKLRGVTPATVRDWERRNWIEQIDDPPIRWRLK